MRQPDPILIRLETARDLVFPAALEETLKELVGMGAIAHYELGTDHVRIYPSRTKRFDLAMLQRELSLEARRYPRARRRGAR